MRVGIGDISRYGRHPSRCAERRFPAGKPLGVADSPTSPLCSRTLRNWLSLPFFFPDYARTRTTTTKAYALASRAIYRGSQGAPAAPIFSCNSVNPAEIGLLQNSPNSGLPFEKG